MIDIMPLALGSIQVESFQAEHLVLHPSWPLPRALAPVELWVFERCDGTTPKAEVQACCPGHRPLAEVLARLDELGLLCPLTIPRRKQGLVVQPLADEALVYDAGSQQAFHLNAVAARALEACDGSTSWQSAPLVAQHLDVRENEALLQLAVGDLAQKGLLETSAQAPRPQSRRSFLATWGTAVAGIMPLLIGAAVPSPASAASCVPFGGTCGAASDCCASGAGGTVSCPTFGSSQNTCCLGLLQPCLVTEVCCGALETAAPRQLTCCPAGSANAGVCGRGPGLNGCCNGNSLCCSNNCSGPNDPVNCVAGSMTCVG